MLGFGKTTSIISNEKMNDNMKIIESLGKSGLLIKGVSKTITNEAKEQEGRFIGKLLGTLGARLLRNILRDEETIKAGGGTIRPG